MAGEYGAYQKAIRQVKQPVVDSRFDFRGGRNSAISSDLLNLNELVDITNARLDVVYGGIVKRPGTQRIHQTALGVPSSITGIIQWDGPNGKQVVATAADGKLYWRDGFTFGTAFTQETPATLMGASATHMVPFRDNTSGAPLVLYIASLSGLYKWTGTGGGLTRLTGSLNAPLAGLLIAYHTRLFARDNNFIKQVSWSGIGLPADWTTGTAAQGGAAMVDVLNGESLNSFEVIGSSLLMGAKNSIMRFTGYSSADIIIAQDTEGVSSEVGVIGGNCLKRFENVATCLSERGPYIVSETGVQPNGEQVFNEFTSQAYTGGQLMTLNVATLANSCIGYHVGRKELWYFIPLSFGGTTNLAAMIQSVRLQSWMGPFIFPFDTTCVATYFDANGVPGLIGGSSDGFVRLLDATGTGSDDVLFDGTSGTSYSMTVETPVLHFGSPGIQKAIRRMKLEAANTFGLTVSVDGGVTNVSVPTVTTLSDIRVDLPEFISSRPTLRFFHGSSNLNVQINGYSLFGHLMNRIGL